jgi:hypothetical protein
MKSSVFQKYFFLLLLSIGIASGNGMLNTVTKFAIHPSKSTTSLQINHQNQTPIMAVCDFVEENENNEDNDAHFSFGFDASYSNFLTFVGLQISANAPSTYHTFPISTNQKINILNCTFLI